MPRLRPARILPSADRTRLWRLRDNSQAPTAGQPIAQEPSTALGGRKWDDGTQHSAHIVAKHGNATQLSRSSVFNVRWPEGIGLPSVRVRLSIVFSGSR
jgi:hypothetical protein